MLTLLTMTGERPEAWELCKRWMRNQTYRNNDETVCWIVVDDGRKPGDYSGMPAEWDNLIIRRQPYWQPGENTQAANILAGLQHVEPGARLLVIEDDDYYSPGYLEEANAWLNDADLVGERHTHYCNVVSGVVRRCKNHAHASLCATGMKGDAIGLFRQVAEGNHKFIDLHLWEQFKGLRTLYDSDLVIGMKGLPGRAGIGSGHRMAGVRDFAQMQSLIGEDFCHYEQLCGGKHG